jgi:hypothetical protein
MRRALRRQLYRHSRQQYDDSFPKKKVHFCFNNQRNPDAESRSQKVGSLKDFEIHSILEKELLHTRQKVINPFDTIICSM